MKGVLDDMIQNSSLIIQNWWDPRKKCCLDSITLFWSLCFGDSITQKSEWWSLKKKQISIVFKFGHPWFSGISVNRLHQWALRPVHCPINTGSVFNSSFCFLFFFFSFLFLSFFRVAGFLLLLFIPFFSLIRSSILPFFFFHWFGIQFFLLFFFFFFSLLN